MERVVDLNVLLKEEIEDWADGYWIQARGFAVVDTLHHIYMVVAVPNYPRKSIAGIVVMAQVVEDKVVIEHDISDQPLWEMLVKRGIPRDQIILTYIGEKLPDIQNTQTGHDDF